MSEILRAEGLQKTFRLSAKQQKLEKTRSRTKVAVRDLSFSVQEGEIFGLLGPNGAGKTTTLRILATLIKPDRGDALIDGCSVTRQPEEVRKRVGFLTSELKLEEFFTPNYLFDFFSELHHVPPEVREWRKKELFDTFCIGEFAEVKVANLSTGMKQKASLAISLVHDPSVIIFDEPTKGIDIGSKSEIYALMRRLSDEGKGVLVVSSELPELLAVCDTIAVFREGEIVETFKHKDATEEKIVYASTNGE